MKNINSVKNEILNFIDSKLELLCDVYEVSEIEKKLNSDNDFTVEIDGEEYRFINEGVIWETYINTIKEITEDCYEIDAPSWLAIDWEETAENCFVDGYGHTFSSYDGSEIEYTFNEENYFIFRTN
tara:strand:- start:114 stop:491 length:378 start_codon:yes stop_codon:yes gene_type:complete